MCQSASERDQRGSPFSVRFILWEELLEVVLLHSALQTMLQDAIAEEA